MKNKRLFSALTNVDDKYVEEASLMGEVKARKRTFRRVLGTVAACFCVAVVGISLWIFTPFSKEPTETDTYADSEYGSENNNGNDNENERGYDEITTRMKTLDFDNLPPLHNYTATVVKDRDPSYPELTYDRIEGVVEKDVIQHTDTHIFYKKDNTIVAYSIAGEQSEQVGSITLDRISVDRLYNYPNSIQGFFLSEDGNKIAVITEDVVPRKYVTYVIIVDVSDPANMKVADEIAIDGKGLTAQLIDGELLLMTRFIVRNPDFDDITTFIPHIEEGGNANPIPMDRIICPDKLTHSNYTVLCKFDMNTMEFTDRSAVLSYSHISNVSSEYILFTRNYNDEIYQREEGWLWKHSMTEIVYITYDGFEAVNTVSVNGYIYDQEDLDQKDGVLRIVTTSLSRRYEIEGDSDQYDKDTVCRFGIGANLYCVDLNSGELIASVEDFDTDIDSVTSVRFDGDSAYVCTENHPIKTSPVFTFDLGDINNITYKKTETLEDISTPLISMGNGFLLNIGDSGQGLMLEIYRETPTGVEFYCKYEYKLGYFSRNSKAYYINTEEQIIGLGIWQRQLDPKEGYIVLHFDGNNLTEILYEKLLGSYDNMRGIYIDGYMYMFGGAKTAQIKVVPLKW